MQNNNNNNNEKNLANFIIQEVETNTDVYLQKFEKIIDNWIDNNSFLSFELDQADSEVLLANPHYKKIFVKSKHIINKISTILNYLSKFPTTTIQQKLNLGKLYGFCCHTLFLCNTYLLPGEENPSNEYGRYCDLTLNYFHDLLNELQAGKSIDSSTQMYFLAALSHKLDFLIASKNEKDLAARVKMIIQNLEKFSEHSTISNLKIAACFILAEIYHSDSIKKIMPHTEDNINKAICYYKTIVSYIKILTKINIKHYFLQSEHEKDRGKEIVLLLRTAQNYIWLLQTITFFKNVDQLDREDLKEKLLFSRNSFQENESDYLFSTEQLKEYLSKNIDLSHYYTGIFFNGDRLVFAYLKTYYKVFSYLSALIKNKYIPAICKENNSIVDYLDRVLKNQQIIYNQYNPLFLKYINDLPKVIKDTSAQLHNFYANIEAIRLTNNLIEAQISSAINAKNLIESIEKEKKNLQKKPKHKKNKTKNKHGKKAENNQDSTHEKQDSQANLNIQNSEEKSTFIKNSNDNYSQTTTCQISACKTKTEILGEINNLKKEMSRHNCQVNNNITFVMDENSFLDYKKLGELYLQIEEYRKGIKNYKVALFIASKLQKLNVAAQLAYEIVFQNMQLLNSSNEVYSTTDTPFWCDLNRKRLLTMSETKNDCETGIELYKQLLYEDKDNKEYLEKINYLTDILDGFKANRGISEPGVEEMNTIASLN